MLTTKLRWTAQLALLGMIAFAAGCGASDAKPTGTAGAAGSTSVADTPDGDGKRNHDGGHALEGWWCTEHGVPESVCARCDSSLVTAFKKKNDWCKSHERPESQCFICSPKRERTFIARFEAKFGRKPPTRTE